MIDNKNEFHIAVESDGKTAVELLAEASKLSKQKIKQVMQKGCVWLEKSTKQQSQKQYIQRLRRAKKVLSVGETLHFYYDENVLSIEPEKATLISDESDYSIWDKPSGMLSQGSKWGDHCTINRWAEKHLKPERPAFIVHRLDRAASGLIIIAHKKQIASAFSTLFQERKIKKQYRVSVEGDFSILLKNNPVEKNLVEQNTVESNAVKSNDLKTNEAMKTIDSKVDSKPAVSHCYFISYDSNSNESVLTVEIETGRKHQIRKHLSDIGFPVVGDRLYGTGKNETDLKLKAVHLSFTCPISGENKLFEL